MPLTIYSFWPCLILLAISFAFLFVFPEENLFVYPAVFRFLALDNSLEFYFKR